ncbi:MAG: hypothetical protein K6L76_02490 [Agarilytica sp.]
MFKHSLLFVVLFSSLCGSAFSEFKEVDGNYAFEKIFSGTSLIKAKFKIVSAGVESTYSDKPQLYLYPIAGSFDGLPHLVREGNALAVVEIYVRNSVEVVSKLLPPSYLAEFSSGVLKIVEGTATIKIGKYLATYECDKPLYIASIINVDNIADLNSSKKVNVKENC